MTDLDLDRLEALAKRPHNEILKTTLQEQVLALISCIRELEAENEKLRAAGEWPESFDFSDDASVQLAVELSYMRERLAAYEGVVKAARVVDDAMTIAANRAMAVDGPAGDELDEFKADLQLRKSFGKAFQTMSKALDKAQNDD